MVIFLFSPGQKKWRLSGSSDGPRSRWQCQGSCNLSFTCSTWRRTCWWSTWKSNAPGYRLDSYKRWLHLYLNLNHLTKWLLLFNWNPFEDNLFRLQCKSKYWTCLVFHWCLVVGGIVNKIMLQEQEKKSDIPTALWYHLKLLSTMLSIIMVLCT